MKTSVEIIMEEFNKLLELPYHELLIQSIQLDAFITGWTQKYDFVIKSKAEQHQKDIIEKIEVVKSIGLQKGYLKS